MARVDEYGYVILDENANSSSGNSSTGNSGNNSYTSGGSSSYSSGGRTSNSGIGKIVAIVIGCLVLVGIIGTVSGLNNRNKNSTYSSSNNQSIISNNTVNDEPATTVYEQNNNDQDYSNDDAYDIYNEYILPYSDSEYISESDLTGLSKTEVRLARNEIYARHGRKFKTDSIREYFESTSWYTPQIDPDSFSEAVFNKYEKANIDTIRGYEKKKGWE